MSTPTDGRSGRLTPLDDASRCKRCGKAFECGIAAGKTQCWCMAQPFKLGLGEDSAGCYCPDCLPLVAAERASDNKPAASDPGNAMP